MSDYDSDSVQRRLDELLAAADVGYKTRYQRVKNRQFADGCNNWVRKLDEINASMPPAEDEAPILDPISQDWLPISELDDLVVLSDGNCYSKRAMQQVIREGTIDIDSGRAHLPISLNLMTDLDYALVGGDQASGSTDSSDAESRTIDVINATFDAVADDEQRMRERLERSFLNWRADRGTLTHSILITLGNRRHFTPALWTKAIDQYWNEPPHYRADDDDYFDGSSLWSLVTRNWSPDQRMSQFPFYVDALMRRISMDQNNPARIEALYDTLGENYVYQVLDMLLVPDQIDWDWIGRWSNQQLPRILHTLESNNEFSNPSHVYQIVVIAITNRLADSHEVAMLQRDEQRYIIDQIRNAIRENAPSAADWDWAAQKFDNATAAFIRPPTARRLQF